MIYDCQLTRPEPARKYRSIIRNQQSSMSSSAVQPLLALLACPVGGNPTQYMIEKAVAHHDLDWRYLTFEVTAEELGDAVRGLRALGFRGADSWPAAQTGGCLAAGSHERHGRDDRRGQSRLAARKNALVGENTEGKGVVEAIRATLDPAGKTVVLLGAGPDRPGRGRRIGSRRRCQSHSRQSHGKPGRRVGGLASEKYAVPVASAPWQGEYRRAAGSRRCSSTPRASSTAPAMPRCRWLVDIASARAVRGRRDGQHSSDVAAWARPKRAAARRSTA